MKAKEQALAQESGWVRGTGRALVQELSRAKERALVQELDRVPGPGPGLVLAQGSPRTLERHLRLRTPSTGHLLQRWQRLGPGCEELRHSARWRKGAWR